MSHLFQQNKLRQRASAAGTQVPMRGSGKLPTTRKRGERA
jgi:hypothetical protein